MRAAGPGHRWWSGARAGGVTSGGWARLLLRLLERLLARRRSTGEVPVDAWLEFSFSTRWHHDVLGGLEYFRMADVRDRDSVNGLPSRWNTLPASRVFDWWDARS